MKEYETILEIINQCPQNHDRDQIFDEVECEDPEQFVLEKYKGREFTYNKSVLPDGTIVFDIFINGMHQRYSFTEF